MMNGTILWLLRVIVGVQFKISTTNLKYLGTEKIILVSNHQSMFDIPLFIWFLRPLKPLFIAKRELRYGIPAISPALRLMGSLLIDRKERKRSIALIRNFAINEANKVIVLFPEGTRAKDGVLKPFKNGGFQALLDGGIISGPCVLYPVAISGSYKLVDKGLLGIRRKTVIDFKVLPGITPTEALSQTLLQKVEGSIGKEVDLLKVVT
jgi:1-acyl-sn-glycerol-3-phosphate acyltransferase